MYNNNLKTDVFDIFKFTRYINFTQLIGMTYLLLTQYFTLNLICDNMINNCLQLIYFRK